MSADVVHRRVAGRAAVGVLLAGALTLTACSSSGGGTGTTIPGSVSGSITVLAASSLTGTFTQLAHQFEELHSDTKIVFSFGASSDLATEVTQGDKADVFAAASTTTMDTVVKDGDASGPQNFATNSMEIATPPDNPAHIAALSDLAQPGVKLAVCAPAVPCGVVAAQVLSNAKLSSVHAAANEQDVKSTVAIVESGEVDAGIVYVTDVKAAGSKVHGVPIAADVNATTTYPIVALKTAPNSPVAKAFVAYVLSGAGQSVLRAAGFAPPR